MILSGFSKPFSHVRPGFISRSTSDSWECHGNESLDLLRWVSKRKAHSRAQRPRCLQRLWKPLPLFPRSLLAALPRPGPGYKPELYPASGLLPVRSLSVRTCCPFSLILRAYLRSRPVSAYCLLARARPLSHYRPLLLRDNKTGHLDHTLAAVLRDLAGLAGPTAAPRRVRKNMRCRAPTNVKVAEHSGGAVILPCPWRTAALRSRGGSASLPQGSALPCSHLPTTRREWIRGYLPRFAAT